MAAAVPDDKDEDVVVAQAPPTAAQSPARPSRPPHRPRDTGRRHGHRRRLRWTALHQRLAEHPTFSRCSREEIRRIARWGDEVEVDAGQVLLAENRIGQWFLAVLSGRVELRRGGRSVAALGPGDHVGDVAVLGFGPQPATATAVTTCTLFVLSTRALVSLAYLYPGLQQALRPGATPTEFVAYVRRLRVDATEAWRTMPSAARIRAGERPTRPAWLTRADSQRAAVPGSFAWLATRALARPEGAAVAIPTPPLRAVVVPLAAVATVVLGATLVWWRPSEAVITPGAPIDAAADISVTGSRTYPIHGRYVLTTVDVGRPALGGLLVALLHGRHTVPVHDDGLSDDAVRLAGVRAFSDSHRHALRAATSALHLRPSRVHVHFRSRDLQGPSAGLVYALALADLLSPEDLARGRTIAATGQLTDEGKVLGVGFVDQKATVAERRGAVLFLVPPGQRPGTAEMRTVEVATLTEAIAVLRSGG